MTIRERLEKTIAGEPVKQPVYAVYDWFVKNRDIDWQSLFDLGLGQINHAAVIDFERPNAEIIETRSEQNGRVRRDVRWVTDMGELHEWYLDEWRQEYLVKNSGDYRIVAHALAGTKYSATDEYFEQSENELSERGLTIGHITWTGMEKRTPLQSIQIDMAGLERFSMDLACEQPELIELIEIMNEQMVEVFRCVLQTKAQQIKLWENLSIETMGPAVYRKYLIPLYERILKTIEGSNKRIVMHYDGKLKVIAGDIRKLRFDGIDSLTPPPEGDMAIAEARKAWPEKFLWLHPSLGWYHLPEKQLIENVTRMAKDAGPGRYCMMISEEVPPRWRRTVPLVLATLNNL